MPFQGMNGGSLPPRVIHKYMFNIGDLVRHKRRENDIGLIIDYRYYEHSNKYHYIVEWRDSDTCWYTEKEISNMFILIS